MRYRFATADDAALLAGMNHRLIRDEGHRNPMSVPQLEERMRHWLKSEYQAVIFEDESGVVGYALFSPQPEHLYLRHFFIEPARRRGGLGREAMRWLMANPWNDHARLRLDVLCANAAGIAFWRALGFQDYCLTLERDNPRSA